MLSLAPMLSLEARWHLVCPVCMLVGYVKCMAPIRCTICLSKKCLTICVCECISHPTFPRRVRNMDACGVYFNIWGYNYSDMFTQTLLDCTLSLQWLKTDVELYSWLVTGGAMACHGRTFIRLHPVYPQRPVEGRASETGHKVIVCQRVGHAALHMYVAQLLYMWMYILAFSYIHVNFIGQISGCDWSRAAQIDSSRGQICTNLFILLSCWWVLNEVNLAYIQQA